MTSYIASHTPTDATLEMLISSVQTRLKIPHDKYNMCGVAYARKYRKDDIFMQNPLVQSFTWECKQETCALTFAHSAGHIAKLSPSQSANPQLGAEIALISQLS